MRPQVSRVVSRRDGRSDAEATAMTGSLSGRLATAPFLPLFDPVSAIVNAFRDAVQTVFEWLALGLVFVLNRFFAGGLTKRMLLLHEDSSNPASSDVFPALNELYDSLVPVFFTLLVIVILSVTITAMFFPQNQQASFHRMAERYLVAVLTVVLIGPYMWEAFFMIHNELGLLIWEAGGGEAFTWQMDAEMVNGASSFGAIVAIFAVLLYVGSGIILTVLLFYGALALRIVILSTSFAITPLIMALWAGDSGITKYGSLSVGLLLNLVTVMFFVGLLLSSIFSTGGAIIDQQGAVTGAFSSAGEFSDTTQPAPGGPEATGKFATAADTTLSQSLINVMFPVTVWIGTMWIAITAVGGLLGGILRGGIQSGSGSALFQSAADKTKTALKDKAKGAAGRVRKSTGRTVARAGKAGQAHTSGGKVNAGLSKVQSVGRTIQTQSATQKANKAKKRTKRSVSRVTTPVQNTHQRLKGEQSTGNKNDNKTSLQKGYTHLSNVGNTMKRAGSQYAHTFATKRGTAAWQDVAAKTRNSDSTPQFLSSDTDSQTDSTTNSNKPGSP